MTEELDPRFNDWSVHATVIDVAPSGATILVAVSCPALALNLTLDEVLWRPGEEAADVEARGLAVMAESFTSLVKVMEAAVLPRIFRGGSDQSGASIT